MKLNAFYQKQLNEAMAALKTAQTKLQNVWDNNEVDLSQEVDSIKAIIHKHAGD